MSSANVRFWVANRPETNTSVFVEGRWIAMGLVTNGVHDPIVLKHREEVAAPAIQGARSGIDEWIWHCPTIQQALRPRIRAGCVSRSVSESRTSNLRLAPPRRSPNGFNGERVCAEGSTLRATDDRLVPRRQVPNPDGQRCEPLWRCWGTSRATAFH